MLELVLNTLRVLVNGPTSEEDESLIPSELFNDPIPFQETVTKLIETNNVEWLYELIIYCVCIDTSARFRLPENIEITDNGNPEGTNPFHYAQLIKTIDETFGCSDFTLGINILRSRLPRDPCYSGLTGRLLSVFEEVTSPSPELKEILEILKEACQHNPCVDDAWWLSTLRLIYCPANVVVETEWYSTGDSVDEDIQLWHLKLNPLLQRLVVVNSEIVQNLPEGSLVDRLSMELNNDIKDLMRDWDDDKSVFEVILTRSSTSVNLEQVNKELLEML